MYSIFGRGEGVITYQEIFEWIYENYNLNDYLSAEELLYEVKNDFNRTQSYFPIEAEDLVKERFQYRREYAELQSREDEKKQIAEMIGGGQVMEGMTDEIVDDLRKPEILGVDVSEYATTREEVIPPEIEKFYSSDKGTFFGRIASGFKRIFRRK